MATEDNKVEGRKGGQPQAHGLALSRATSGKCLHGANPFPTLGVKIYVWDSNTCGLKKSVYTWNIILKGL